MPLSYTLHHVGIAVSDTQKLTRMLQTHLGLEHSWSETVAHQGVTVHFLDAGAAKLELLEAVAPDSPIAKFLSKRKGGVHHLAFEVHDIDVAFRRLQRAGFRPLSPGPTTGAKGKRIFFLHPKETFGILLEFCQRSEPLAPIALVSDREVPALTNALRRHALLLAVSSVQEAHRHMVHSGIDRAHFLLIGSGSKALSAINGECCLSLALHSMHPTEASDRAAFDVPTLISAPVATAEHALGLHRNLPGSQLCILPTAHPHASRVDPQALVPVLVKHFLSAQR